MPFCVKCGAHMSDEDLFCGACGAPAKHPAAQNPDSKTYTLLISRKKQIMAAVNAYDVYIDGGLLGRITNGQTLAARVFSDTISVEIRSTVKIPFMKLPVARMTLKLKENPRIDFYVVNSGAIVPAVIGADVIASANE